MHAGAITTNKVISKTPLKLPCSTNIPTTTSPASASTTSSISSKSLSPYDPVIARQQRRISQLEGELAQCTTKLHILKTRQALTYQLYDPHNSNTLRHLHPSNQLHIPTNHNNMQNLCGSAAPGGGSAVGLTGLGGCGLGVDEDERAGKTRYWTEVEHNQFLWAVTCFGPKNYVAISQFVGTRTAKQVRTHAQKYQMKLEREANKRKENSAGTANGVESSMDEDKKEGDEGDESKSGGDRGDGDAGEKKEKTEDIECEKNMGVEDGTISMMAPPPTPAAGVGGIDGAPHGGLDWLGDLSSSPISRDSSIEDEMLGQIEEESMIPTASIPVQATLKKNSSLANLADYDEFYKKLTHNANEQKKSEEDGDGEKETNDEEMADGPQAKTSHFGDSLLRLD